jgi:small subunit ribosomal protein S4
MARYIDANCKLCRRERQKLFLKGTKCLTEKCPLEKHNYPPGQFGTVRRAKVSDYGIQLREKQKIKKIYGILERQFRTYFEKASSQKGRTGENLIKLLEQRLDNTIYRLGLAPSRKAARQLVLHRHFNINKKVTNIPSYLLKPGDLIQVREKSKKLETIHSSLKRVREDTIMPWLSIDKAALLGTFLRIPDRADIPLEANEQLVVELYSK